MLTPVRFVAPVAPLISEIEVKANRRREANDDDLTIRAIAAAVESYLDGWSGILGRCILTQTWRSFAPGFASGIDLPFPGAVSAVVKYLDPAEAEQTVGGANYRVENGTDCSRIVFVPTWSFPATAVREDAVRVEAVYGAAAAPEAIRRAAVMLASAWDMDREGQIGLPPAVEALIAPWRVARF